MAGGPVTREGLSEKKREREKEGRKGGGSAVAGRADVQVFTGPLPAMQGAERQKCLIVFICIDSGFQSAPPRIRWLLLETLKQE
jgi:hypothetical protein